MATRRVEDELERLTLLREAPPAEAVPALRKALSDRVNVVVAKAAKIAAERQIHELIQDLLRAFDRLFEKAVERDPQCWGKTAIAAALKDLEHTESAPFLRGMRHVQMEPVWGGQADTAETLRGTCLLALVACADLDRGEALRCFVSALTEKAHTIRREAARALGQMAGEEAALVLRLKVRMGDSEAEVIGQVLDSLLAIEGRRALPFLRELLETADAAVREEAALALGSSRLPEAVELLQETWTATRDPSLREVLLRAISASRQEQAIEWLLGFVKTGRMRDAIAALRVLALHRESEEIRRAVRTAAETREPEVQTEYRNLFEA